MLGPQLYDKGPAGAIPKPGKDAIVSRFFKFIGRWLDMPLGGTNNETLPGRFYDSPRHPRQRIDLH
jgi:hypothetical protein